MLASTVSDSFSYDMTIIAATYCTGSSLLQSAGGYCVGQQPGAYEAAQQHDDKGVLRCTGEMEQNEAFGIFSQAVLDLLNAIPRQLQGYLEIFTYIGRWFPERRGCGETPQRLIPTIGNFSVTIACSI